MFNCFIQLFRGCFHFASIVWLQCYDNRYDIREREREREREIEIEREREREREWLGSITCVTSQIVGYNFK